MHNCQDLVRIFHHCFYHGYQTQLISGAEEPLYIPAKAGKLAYIYFTHDYFSSALHEIAHWCIAGEQRRKLEDYGYWYKPDDRTAEQQRAFEQVEVKPQALEWIFSACCNLKFQISADNLSSTAGASQEFEEKVYQQACIYLSHGLTGRKGVFAGRLANHYRHNRMPVPSELKCPL